MARRCQVHLWVVSCPLARQRDGRQVLTLAKTSGRGGQTGCGGSRDNHFDILPAAPSLARESLRGPVSHPLLPVLLLNGSQRVTQGPQ